MTTDLSFGIINNIFSCSKQWCEIFESQNSCLGASPIRAEDLGVEKQLEYEAEQEVEDENEELVEDEEVSWSPSTPF